MVKIKKILATMLCILLILSSVSTGFAEMAEPAEPTEPKQQETVTEAVYGEDGNSGIFEGVEDEHENAEEDENESSEDIGEDIGDEEEGITENEDDNNEEIDTEEDEIIEEEEGLEGLEIKQFGLEDETIIVKIHYKDIDSNEIRSSETYYDIENGETFYAPDIEGYIKPLEDLITITIEEEQEEYSHTFFYTKIADVWIDTDGNEMSEEHKKQWEYRERGGTIVLNDGYRGYYGDFTSDGQIIGKMPAIINGKKVTDLNMTFYELTELKIAPELPEYVTNISSTFAYCSNLHTASTLPNGLVQMNNAFQETAINVAPIIPASVTKMVSTFSGCENLIEAPDIPDGVYDMGSTFYGCISLIKAPIIPDSVINMYQTFSFCKSLEEAPILPNNVDDLRYTFNWCENLTGDIVIPDSVRNIEGIFRNTVLPITMYYSSSSYEAVAYEAPPNVTKVNLDGGIEVYVDDVQVDFPDVQPIVSSERILVPIRFVMQDLGFDVYWSQEEYKAVLRKTESDGKKIEVMMEPDKGTMLVNGKETSLIASVQLVSPGRLMLPGGELVKAMKDIYYKQKNPIPSLYQGFYYSTDTEGTESKYPGIPEIDDWTDIPDLVEITEDNEEDILNTETEMTETIIIKCIDKAMGHVIKEEYVEVKYDPNKSELRYLSAPYIEGYTAEDSTIAINTSYIYDGYAVYVDYNPNVATGTVTIKYMSRSTNPFTEIKQEDIYYNVEGTKSFEAPDIEGYNVYGSSIVLITIVKGQKFYSHTFFYTEEETTVKVKLHCVDQETQELIKTEEYNIPAGDVYSGTFIDTPDIDGYHTWNTSAYIWASHGETEVEDTIYYQQIREYTNTITLICVDENEDELQREDLTFTVTNVDNHVQVTPPTIPGYISKDSILNIYVPEDVNYKHEHIAYYYKEGVVGRIIVHHVIKDTGITIRDTEVINPATGSNNTISAWNMYENGEWYIPEDPNYLQIKITEAKDYEHIFYYNIGYEGTVTIHHKDEEGNELSSSWTTNVIGHQRFYAMSFGSDKGSSGNSDKNEGYTVIGDDEVLITIEYSGQHKEHTFVYKENEQPTEPDENEGTDPVEPTDPDENEGTDPTEPVDPDENEGTDPTEPVDPDENEGTDPTEPTEPDENEGTDPTEPTDPDENEGTDPTEPTEPDENEGTDPTEPTDPEENEGTDPTEPTDPEENEGTDPTEPTEPTDPDENEGTDPTEPTDPDENETGGNNKEEPEEEEETGGTETEEPKEETETGGTETEEPKEEEETDGTETEEPKEETETDEPEEETEEPIIEEPKKEETKTDENEKTTQDKQDKQDDKKDENEVDEIIEPDDGNGTLEDPETEEPETEDPEAEPEIDEPKTGEPTPINEAKKKSNPILPILVSVMGTTAGGLVLLFFYFRKRKGLRIYAVEDGQSERLISKKNIKIHSDEIIINIKRELEMFDGENILRIRFNRDLAVRLQDKKIIIMNGNNKIDEVTVDDYLTSLDIEI